MCLVDTKYVARMVISHLPIRFPKQLNETRIITEFVVMNHF